ncbi:hypothetical protein [Robertmurraya korlensis]|uniref:hypothetical protein n=1 Tax=Robertmurraya korlensis TaxID=519977 RepID=UPI000826F8EE|nr:hypothetical protein [Robertmurraya korlensis]
MKLQIQNKQETILMRKVLSLISYYLIVASILPQLKLIPGYTVSVFAAMFAWFICALLLNPIFFVRPQINTLLIIFFVSYTFLTPYLFGNSTLGNRYLEHGVMFVFYLMYKYNKMFDYSHISKSLVKWIIPVVIYTSVVTFYGLLNNPYLARSIKTSGEDTMMLRAQGVGGYELIYFLVFVSIILFYILFNIKLISIYKKILSYLILLLFLLTIVFANYFTALLIVTIAFSLILIISKGKLLIKSIFILFGIIFLFFSKEVINLIISWLISFLEEGSTVYKLQILQANIMGSNGEGSLLLNRTLTLESSWNAFLDNPIIGIITNPIESNGGFMVGFGQHSHFIDTLALFGLFFGILNIILIIQPFIVRMRINPDLIGFNLTILISTIILFLMNNATTSIGFAVFFVYPVVYDWFVEREKIVKNAS